MKPWLDRPIGEKMVQNESVDGFNLAAWCMSRGGCCCCTPLLWQSVLYVCLDFFVAVTDAFLYDCDSVLVVLLQGHRDTARFS